EPPLKVTSLKNRQLIYVTFKGGSAKSYICKVFKVHSKLAESGRASAYSPLLYPHNFRKYFGTNSVNEMELSGLLSSDLNICEYIPSNKPLRLFFDIERKKIPHPSASFDVNTCENLINVFCKDIRDLFPAYIVEFYKSKSHIIHDNLCIKFSMHIVTHIKKSDGTELLFKNVAFLKKFILSHQSLWNCPLVDMSVYRKNGGLMRAINQSKKNEQRPLTPTCLTIIYSNHMITNFSIPENNKTIEIHKQISYEENIVSNISPTSKSNPCVSSEWINLTMLDFLQKWYESLKQPFIKIHKITLNENNSLYTLYRGYCMFTNCIHKSNNQTLKIDNEFLTFKCLDQYCIHKKITVGASNYISENTLNLLLKDQGKAVVTKIIKQVDDGVQYVTQTNNICFEAPCSPQLQGPYLTKMNESTTNYKHVVSTLNHEIHNTHTGAAISIGSVDLKTINNFAFNVQNYIITNINSDNIHLDNNTNINTRNKVKLYNVISNILISETWLTCEQKKLIIEYFNFPITKTLIELFFKFFTQIIYYSNGIYYQYLEDIYITVKHTQDLIASFEQTIESLFDNIRSTLVKQNHSKQLIDTLCPMYNSLNSSHTKNKFLSFIISNYEIADLSEKLDSDILIIPFKSKYYDHRTRSFLAYHKNVYISKKLTYDVDFDQDVSLVQNFMVSIFPEQCVYKMMMQILANALIPIEPPRSLFNLYGSGANGKSVFVRLVMQTFEHLGVELSGDIFRVSPTRDSNSPSPSLIPLCKSRIAFCLEPTKQALSSSMVKKLCGGGDTIVCRPLYSNMPIYFKNVATMFMSSNDIPTFDDVDQALSTRLIIIPFKRIFVQNPKHKNERPIDLNISHKIYNNDQYKIGLMSSLLKIIMSVEEENGVKIDISNTSFDYVNPQQEALTKFELWLRDHIVPGTKSNVLNFKSVYNSYLSSIGKIGDKVKYREYLAKFHNYIQLT
ncbi:hypothetical protein HZS_7690, partial [Henneguya salminicola]